MANTKIEWTDKVWNPITGCSHSGSPGCDHCYAKRMANRLKGRYGYPKDDPFRVTFHPGRLEEPFYWKKPSRIFVCSMGDLFHKDVLLSNIGRILRLARGFSAHTFLFLTKRPERMKEALLAFDMNGECNGLPCDHLWFGVSVEDQKTVDERIPILLQIPAAKRFVSVEPMLGKIDIEPYLSEDPDINPAMDMPDWIICGGETGPGARPLHPDWVRSLRDQCLAANTPFFFKSWGEWMPVGQKPVCVFKPIGKHDAKSRFHLYDDEGKNVSMKIGRKAAGSNLDGKECREFPTGGESGPMEGGEG